MRPDREVNFAVVGAQKSGTRALRHFLSAHPDIGLSRQPETHYFSEFWETAPEGDYDNYHVMFEDDALRKVTGDITPIYIYQDGCLERLHAYNPDMKIVVILRNPIERAYSQWAMQMQRQEQTEGFLQTILSEPFRYMKHGKSMVYSHVARGFYGRQLERLFKIFSRNQVLLLRNEELRDDHANTIGKVYRFLGVDDRLTVEPEIVHSNEYGPMPLLARWILRLIYRFDRRRVQNLTGWDLSAWR